MARYEVAAAILAGGAGTRFWPLSRAARPKPFLDLMGQGPLIRLTTERLFPLVPASRVFYVIGETLVDLTRSCVPKSMGDQMVTEPIPRNTLGAVLLAMAHVRARFGTARLAIFPSDHVVTDVPRFQAILAQAYEVCDRHIVTLGIQPTRPETGFGYIEAGAEASGAASLYEAAPMLRVRRFVEKPNLPTAMQFLASGGFYWNAGIFIFDVDFMYRHMKETKPELAQALDDLTAGLRSVPVDPNRIRQILEPLPNINIDRAIMEESAHKLLVIPSQFGWSDVGTWDALCEDLTPGVSLAVGDVVEYNSHSNVAISAPEAPLVALVGVSELVVVATPDAVLVTRRGEGQDVGKLVTELKKAGRTKLL